MIHAALHEAELRSVITDALRLKGEKRIIAVACDVPWTGPNEITINDPANNVQTYDVRVARSSLEFREWILRSQDAKRGLVVLTALGEREVGRDVLAKLAKRRITIRDKWRVLKQLFRATRIDPTLVRNPNEMLERELLDAAPIDGFDPVPNGFLDEDTVWHVISRRRFGLSERRPSLAALLRWSAQPSASRSWGDCPTDVRDAFLGRCRATLGNVGELFATIVQTQGLGDALPLALVCDVLFPNDRNEATRLEIARARLEATLAGASIAPESARRLARAGDDAWTLGELNESIRRTIQTRAESWTDRLQAREEAWRSNLLWVAAEQRLERSAAALGQFLDVVDKGSTSEKSRRLDHVRAALRGARNHRWSQADAAIRESLDTVERLASFLADRRAPNERTVADHARRFAHEGAIVDMLRDRLRRNLSGPEIWREALRRLVSLVNADRERANESFARTLSQEEQAGFTSTRDVLRIEEVLDRVVSEIAATGPVLVVVLDAMSLAAFEEIRVGIEACGFSELVMNGRGIEDPTARLVAISTVPTVTEFARASLLCGRLTVGSADVERAGFEAHPGLKVASRRGFPPRIFHKSDLADPSGAGFSESVRAEIESQDRRVVGVVLNAIDDHLSKGDQLRAEWDVDRIKSLQDILNISREAKRTIVVTADHGHVLDHQQCQRRAAEGGARWRIAGEPPGEDEVLFVGPRVAYDRGGKVVVPWTELLRYGAKQNGYHGGGTLQEVVVPVAVFAPAGLSIDGWSELPLSTPSWFDISEPTSPGERPDEALPTSSVRELGDAREPARRRNGTLFDNLIPEVGPERSTSLIDRLLASELYAKQKRLVARAAIDDRQVRAALGALESHGGTMTRRALARELGLSEVRIDGFVSVLRRLLNVDGFDVLSGSGDQETVRLDAKLLEAQFGV